MPQTRWQQQGTLILPGGMPKHKPMSREILGGAPELHEWKCNCCKKVYRTEEVLVVCADCGHTVHTATA